MAEREGPPSTEPRDATAAALHAADLERQIRIRTWIIAILILIAIAAAAVAIVLALDARDKAEEVSAAAELLAAIV